MPVALSALRRRRARLAAILSALVCLGLGSGVGIAAAAPSAAQLGLPRHVANDAFPVAGASLAVAPEDPIVLANTEEIAFNVAIENPGEEAIPAGRIEFRLAPDRVEPGTRLPGADAEALPGDTPVLAEASIGAISAGGVQTASATIATADLPLSADSPQGVYLVEAALLPAKEEPSADASPGLHALTPIVWRGPGAETVNLSTIVPIVFPADVRTLPTRRQLETAATQWEKLLVEARALRATLAIDPRAIAAIRAYGDDAPENARLLLPELESYPHDSFLLQFGDADLAAQAALGFDEPLAPKTLDFVSRFGSFAPSGTSQEQDQSQDPADEPAQDPDPETADPSLPSLDELLTWPAKSKAAWPAEGEANQETLALARSAGLEGVVLDSENVSLGGGPRAEVAGMPATITDAGLAAASRDAIGGENDVVRNSGTALMVAQLVLAAQGQSPGVVLGLDRGAVAEGGDATSELLATLDRLGWTKRIPVAEQAAGTATLKAADPLENRRELLRSALKREASIVEIGGVLEHPEYLIGYQRARLLEVFGTRYAAPGVDFDEVAGAFRARDAELLSGVQAISTEHTQLVGVSTRVPVQLRNALPFDAVVEVRADPASAALSVDERVFTDVRVPAEGNGRVLVPVQSRVASGESGLVVSVTALSGEPTSYTGTLDISIRSSIETVGVWVLGGLAALLLVLGIWRSVRRKRRPAAQPAE
ncbi:DUF6049 family protein [Leucobacter luti]|uniref:DUF6049 family protein n=1 Tax=Leucobacter luti TaxID=340320 RepID=UPI003CFF38E6